jgi:4-hydroxy-tetrahydrodipicolinate reductase
MGGEYMYLIIVGNGQMGRIIKGCAEEDKAFDKIEIVEPLDNKWPEEKADVIIDFSHHSAIKDIYEYCRVKGGNIPVVIGTTGQDETDEEVIKQLEKICPVERKSNFSRGIFMMNKLAEKAKDLIKEEQKYSWDISIEEIHHTKKKDSPSGTAKTLCSILGEPWENVAAIRMGNVFGEHKIYLAAEDEVIEISHRAYSKKIFALGAIEVAKKMMSLK